MQSPVKKIYITQAFGANPSYYSKWGLNGHNGIDFRAFLPDGSRCYSGEQSPVFAPHDGVIKENYYDSVGYGNYVKIESSIEGSVLAHFSSKCKLAIGTKVKKGDFIAYQGTTGNSTGIHLHWGYYRLPRNRANGYNGFINQQGLYSAYQTESENMSKVELDSATFERLVDKSNKYDAIEALGYGSTANTIKTRFTLLEDRKKEAEELASKYKKQVDDLLSLNEKLTEDISDLGVVVTNKDIEIAELEKKLEKCGEAPEEKPEEEEERGLGYFLTNAWNIIWSQIKNWKEKK